MTRVKIFAALMIASVLVMLPQAASAVKFTPLTSGPLTLAGSPIYMSTTGDFTGDGRDDIAAVTDSNAIYAWYGQPTEVLGGGEAVASGSSLGGASTIRSGDVNGDGDLDLLIGATRNWEVYFGTGNGQFSNTPDTTFEVPYAEPSFRMPVNAYSNTLGDVDQDGDLDIVFGMYESAFAVMLNNGSGSFAGHPGGLQYVIPQADRASFDGLYSPALGDWNGDDVLDLAFALNRDGGGDTPIGVYVADGNGDGTFNIRSQGPLLEGQRLQSMLTLDLNQDGKDDLAAAANTVEGSNNIQTLVGSDASLAANPNAGGGLDAGNAPYQMAAVDLDDRQRTDLAVGLRGARKIAGIRNLGDGSLTPISGSPFDLPQIGGKNFVVNGVHSGDFNGDGAPDLAADSSHGTDLGQARGIHVLLSRPDVKPNPASVNFGVVIPGSSSDSRTVTIANEGAALALPSQEITITGINQDQFSLGAPVCGDGPISGNSACTQAVTFSPTSGGTKNATLRYDLNNHPDISVPLTGIGGEPILSGPSATTHFGETIKGGTRTATMTFTSAGSSPVVIGTPLVVNSPSTGSDRFSITTDGCHGKSLAPTETCDLTVTFAPTATGFKSTSVSMPSSDPSGGGTRLFGIDGTGIDPKMSVDPDGHDFGDVEMEDPASPVKTFTISSTGTSDLKVTPISIDGQNSDDFTFVNPPSCGEVTTGSTCQFQVRFDPEQGDPGRRTAEIVLKNNTSEPEVRLDVDGTATRAEFTLSDQSIDLEDVDPYYDPDPTAELTLNSTGTASLRATAEIVDDQAGAFSINGDRCLEPTDPELDCSYTIEFDPSGLASGEYTADIEITSNGGDANVPISATIVKGDLLADPNHHDFGQIDVGTFSSKVLTLTSSGSGRMVVESASIVGGGASAFGITANACGDPVASGGTCPITVRYSPTVAGNAGAQLKLDGNFGSRILPLAGIGKPVVVVPPPPGSAKLALTIKAPRRVKAGKKLVLTVTVSNVGNAASQSILLNAKLPKKAARKAKAIQIPTLAAGQSATHKIKVKIKRKARKGKKLAARVTASSAGLMPVSVTRKVKVR